MEVSRLIEYLLSYDGDTEVAISVNSMTFEHITDVNDEDYEDGKIIYLEGR